MSSDGLNSSAPKCARACEVFSWENQVFDCELFSIGEGIFRGWSREILMGKGSRTPCVVV